MVDTHAPKTLPPEQIMMQMLLGKFVSQALGIVVELGIADLLRDGPRSAADLASAAGCDADALYRTLRALASQGVFDELPERRFQNNPLSAVLSSDSPSSLGALARWFNHESAWRAWGDFRHSLMTGQPSFDKVHGRPIFDHFKNDPATGAIFNAAMTSLSGMTGTAVAEAYDFSTFARLVDLGGGHGAFLSIIAARHPTLRGTVFDLPEVVKGTTAHLCERGLEGRIDAVGGNFFDAVPAGADAYIMKFILHDWDDARCVRILRNCRTAMAAGGKVLVVDTVIGDGPASIVGKFLDLEMLAVTSGGRERTAAEFAALFEQAGLRLTRIIPTRSPVSIIEAQSA